MQPPVTPKEIDNTPQKTEPSEPIAKNPKLLASIWNNSEINSNRILEKNSITCIGIPTEICTQEILSGLEYFGQFGKIELMTVKCRAEKYNGFELANFACIKYSSCYEASIALCAIESTF